MRIESLPDETRLMKLNAREPLVRLFQSECFRVTLDDDDDHANGGVDAGSNDDPAHPVAARCGLNHLARVHSSPSTDASAKYRRTLIAPQRDITETMPLSGTRRVCALALSAHAQHR